MKLSISRDIKLLSFAFLLTFVGQNGVQQYVTNFFLRIGLPSIGFQVLILIYTFFVLATPLSALIVSRYGAKKVLIVAPLFYSLFILSLVTKSLIIIYLASAFLGIAASLLWTGQGTYLVRATTDENLGANAGFFNAVFSLGSASGVIAVGFLIGKISYEYSFLLAALLPLISIPFMMLLKDLRPKPVTNPWRQVLKAMTSKTAWQVSTIWFSVFFVYGLAIGLIPITIKAVLGLAPLGILASLLSILPILLSYNSGKFSDGKGRKMMLLISFPIIFLALLFLSIRQNPFLIVTSVLLIAIYYSIVRTMVFALYGDRGERYFGFLSSPEIGRQKA